MNRSPLREITEDDIRTYEKDGVILLPDVFDMDWVERMRVALDRVLANPGILAANYQPDGSPGRYAFETFIWLYDEDFRDMAMQSPLAELSATMLKSEKVNILIDSYFVKEPRSPYPTNWHHDQPAQCVEGPKLCSTWVPLDSVTKESGAIEFVRGSHAWGKRFGTPREVGVKDTAPAGPGKAAFKGPNGEDIYLDNDDQSEFEPLPAIEAARDKYDIFTIEAEPGDCIVTHMLTLHHSPGNATGGRRRAIGHRWMGDGATYAARASKNRVYAPRDPQLSHGDPFPPDHHLFPQMWPPR